MLEVVGETKSVQGAVANEVGFSHELHEIRAQPLMQEAAADENTHMEEARSELLHVFVNRRLW